MDQARLLIFIAEFTQQLEQIVAIYSTLERKTSKLTAGPVSAELVESIGYWLHNLYCAHEDMFKIVAACWENQLGLNGAYHKNLLKRMTLDIPGVRPALLSDEGFTALDELRGFRHVFRHSSMNSSAIRIVLRAALTLVFLDRAFGDDLVQHGLFAVLAAQNPPQALDVLAHAA